MDFKDIVLRRRSCRSFTEEALTEEEIRLLLRAALMSPTSKNQRNWSFIAVRDRKLLLELSKAKALGGGFIAEAAAAIVILGNPSENDCWIEDCAIAAVSIQYQAEELGLGSCWAQMRARKDNDDKAATENIRAALSLSDEQCCLCVIALGHKAAERKPQNEDKLLWDRVSLR